MTELSEIMTDQQAYSTLVEFVDDADPPFDQRMAVEVALDALAERMGQLCVDETPSVFPPGGILPPRSNNPNLTNDGPVY